MKTKKLTGTVFVALLSASSLVAIAGTAPTANSPASTQKAAPIATPQDNPAKEKLKDNTFVAQAAQSGLTEVEISKLAAAKATDQKLKKYATATIKDQSANNMKLIQVATQNRIDLPKKLDDDNANMVKQLNGLSGAEFDKAYINLMKKSQDTKVALFDNAAAEPTLNVELRVFANQTLPAIRARQQNTHSLLPDSNKLSQR